MKNTLNELVNTVNEFHNVPVIFKDRVEVNLTDDYQILSYPINKDSFITYCLRVADGVESCEYYTGENYVSNSNKRSFSRHYKRSDIPKKHISTWRALKEYYGNIVKNQN